jgi:hypothetical protein
MRSYPDVLFYCLTIIMIPIIMKTKNIENSTITLGYVMLMFNLSKCVNE